MTDKIDRKCEGRCEEHIGEIRHVYSGYAPDTKEKWDWWYCLTAIEDDTSRGIDVTDYETGEFL